MDKSKTFILFIFGMFEDYEDVEYFCTDIIGELPFIKTVRYVIENTQNIIVIFESELDYTTLSKEMFTILIDDNIKFYFMLFWFIWCWCWSFICCTNDCRLEMAS